MEALTQFPEPGSHRLQHRGDVLTLTLTVPPSMEGRAWLRTNLGQGERLRQELVDHVEKDAPVLERDWHDLPMETLAAGRYSLTLPLLETGRFEAKAFFLPDVADDAEAQPQWPRGDNVVIKVEPADCVSNTTLYSAFVRQFGPHETHEGPSALQRAAIEELESDGYEVIPRSGKFRDLIAQLDHITGTLGFRIIQLLPIFPTPTTFARMGRYGSPFAALDLMEVDPALAEFDRRTTPLQQFIELLDETHRRDAKLFLDIPINHTGWASWLQNHHPEWFKREEGERAFQSPGAWGVVWADLSELDYQHRELWHYMADVFLFWCRLGVDGFRCDAGYMVPLPVWHYITAKVRQQFPDTVFFLEGLGGDKKIVFDLLDRANLNWAYSELFQNYHRQDVEAILRESIAVSSAQGAQIHFAETHDNLRLAATSQPYARMRTALAALCSHSGGFGITAGVEWFATEKIDVHGAPSLNWNASTDQIEEIQRLNTLLARHPAFWSGAQLSLIPSHPGPALTLLRESADGEDTVLVLVNLDLDQSAWASWDTHRWPLPNDSGGLWDLLTGNVVSPEPKAGTDGISLAPGQARCLSKDRTWTHRIGGPDIHADGPIASSPRPGHREQRLRAKVLELLNFFEHGLQADAPRRIAALATELYQAPFTFCRTLCDHPQRRLLIRWVWPRDTRRVVLWPDTMILAVRSPHPFMLELDQGERVLVRESSLSTPSGEHFSLLRPPQRPGDERQTTVTLRLKSFTPEGVERHTGTLSLLSDEPPRIPMGADKDTVIAHQNYGLATNARGAMIHARAAWGDLQSQYDALLAANPSSAYPVDRRILLTRLRGWVVYRGYSREIDLPHLDQFAQSSQGTLQWIFTLPIGMGQHVRLAIRMRLLPGQNATSMTVERLTEAPETPLALDGATPVRLILRPDIENRGFHEKTKAFLGPETDWPEAIATDEHGFTFSPKEGCSLRMDSSLARFVHEPEWHYMQAHPIDAERGLDGATDLFSPGYFTCLMRSGAPVGLHAYLPAEAPAEASTPLPDFAPSSCTLEEAAKRAIDAFIVKRDDTKTVIAGYPWFLDWGRDTLICLRGIIAAGRLEDARDIVRQFARFERQGTLPNMIRGGDDSNRDTSDAPLWLFVACADLFRADGHREFAEADCGDGRRLREILSSIARHYLSGTPNGINVDPESGLVFSPSHFTWMDTNHPAGTPREGYPIEIQSLWHHALTLLATLAPQSDWQSRADQVAESILRFFWSSPQDFLSDCLHARPGTRAADALPDDHLRCNQLFAVTLGAVTDETISRAVVRSSEDLLVPGAIRSLADRPVKHLLPVHQNGKLTNDPAHPYWGHYQGDEDTRRKPAYHNGTAWTWPFPSYAEALALTHGPSALPMARAILSSSAQLFADGCLGHLPEITDGDAPHAQRGCGAQAWGVTELYRVLHLLEN